MSPGLCGDGKNDKTPRLFTAFPRVLGPRPEGVGLKPIARDAEKMTRGGGVGGAQEHGNA